MSHKVFLSGIYSEGYGMIAKSVMRDKDLTIEAKAIYSYLVSFSGAGLSSFPSTKLMLSDLGISHKRYLNHRKQLEEKGYIEITRERTSNGFSKNKYRIISDLSVSGRFVHVQDVHEQNVHEQNVGTISNSFISNSNISNSSNKDIVDSNESTNLSKYDKVPFFNKFWELYPKKVAKGQAVKTFKKQVTNEETFNLIAEDLKKRKSYDGWIKEDGKFIPNPSTYLNQERWTDVYETNNQEEIELDIKLW